MRVKLSQSYEDGLGGTGKLVRHDLFGPRPVRISTNVLWGKALSECPQSHDNMVDLKHRLRVALFRPLQMTLHVGEQRFDNGPNVERLLVNRRC